MAATDLRETGDQDVAVVPCVDESCTYGIIGGIVHRELGKRGNGIHSVELWQLIKIGRQPEAGQFDSKVAGSAGVVPAHERCPHIQDRSRTQSIRVRQNGLYRYEIFRSARDDAVAVNIDWHVPGVPPGVPRQKPLLVRKILVATE